MKELGKRFRGLFVLLLAATFFLQGGWFMPVNAAAGEEYLIVMQNMDAWGNQLEGTVTKGGYPVSNSHYADSRILGVYQSTNGMISSMIGKKAITNSNVRSLSGDGIKSLDNISDIKSPDGATLYCLTAEYDSGGYFFQIVDQNDEEIQRTVVGAPVAIGQSKGSTHTVNQYFYKIENVGSVTEALLKVGSGIDHEYCDYAADEWKRKETDPEITVADVLENSKSGRATASYSLGTEHFLKLHIIDPEKLTTITFDTDGGSKIAPIRQEIGTPVTKPADPTKEGYTFVGWDPEFPTEMPEVNMTLKAKWKKNAGPVVTKYTITYDLDGGTLDGMTGTVTEEHPAGAVITLPAPTKDGYTFDHWEGSTYYAGDQYTVTGDHTFKAVWKTGAGGNGKKGSGAKTGDENALGAWVVLLLAAMAGTTGMVYARKRKGE